MRQESEPTAQYSGAELEGGARDVALLGKVIARLRLERAFAAAPDSDFDQHSRLMQMQDGGSEFREHPTEATQ